MNRFSIGDKVKVLSHTHPDVLPGTLGVIDCSKEGGYGVKITGEWQIAGHDRGKTYHGTEVVWYPAEKLELVYSDTGETKHDKDAAQSA